MSIVKCLNHQCDYFQKTIPNYEFCPFCGEPVNMPITPLTPSPIPSENFNPAPPTPLIPVTEYPREEEIQSPRVVPPTVVEKLPINLSLILVGTEQKFIIPQKNAVNKVYLGRPENPEKSTSVIDLNNIPYSERISRSHAYIYWNSQQYCYLIVDNNSTNGTILNGITLTPNQPYPLGPQDKIELGMEQKVVFKVQIE